MPHEYTRQRQGRDFLFDNTAAANKKSLDDRLEQCRKEMERNAAPVDGHEPPQERSAPKHGRSANEI